MDRKEEINKEIDSLETRIITLRREYNDRIGNVYYKIVKITDKGSIICITVDHKSISKEFFVHDSFMEKCTLEKFEYEYNRILNYITKDE